MTWLSEGRLTAKELGLLRWVLQRAFIARVLHPAARWPSADAEALSDVYADVRVELDGVGAERSFYIDW